MRLNRKPHENERFPGCLLKIKKMVAGEDDQKLVNIATQKDTEVGEQKRPALSKILSTNQASDAHRHKL